MAYRKGRSSVRRSSGRGRRSYGRRYGSGQSRRSYASRGRRGVRSAGRSAGGKLRIEVVHVQPTMAQRPAEFVGMMPQAPTPKPRSF